MTVFSVASDFSVATKEYCFGDKTYNYEVTSGFLPQKNAQGKVVADLFFTAYSLSDTSEKKRSITFAFNGGPGSSSIWLHIGLLGPKSFVKEEGQQQLLLPSEWVDNPATFLDYTDIVFIDPIGTGFSRVREGENEAQFYSPEGDVKSIGFFIRDYLTEFKRWNSTKYLIGESYGAFRAIGVADYLSQEHSAPFNGIVLVSPAINFQLLQSFYPSDLSIALSLPTYSAIAHYYGKISEEQFQRVHEFSTGEYLKALFQGDLLSDVEYQDVATALSEMTGIPEEKILAHRLRIDENLFRKEILSDEGKIIGIFDGRFKGYFSDLDRPTDYSEDPSVHSIDGRIAGVFHQYLLDELEFPSSLFPYIVLSFDVNERWEYLTNYPYFLEGDKRLKRLLVANPHFKVMIVGGRYDLATPFSSVDYTLSHLHLPSPVKQQITIKKYTGGHMFYLDEDESWRFKEDFALWHGDCTK